MPGSRFTYAQLVGTSQAAPHVTGATALALALWPGLTQTRLQGLLRAVLPVHVVAVAVTLVLLVVHVLLVTRAR